MIEFHCLDVTFTIEHKAALADWLRFAAKSESNSCGSVNLIICSDDHLLGMNQQFLKHDYYTDIITFDTSEGSTISGDLYISIERVKDNATGLGICLVDELHRVMVHGLLHLCGYGDKSHSEETIMRSKEDHYLSLRAFM